jgi:hypothetical protein
MALGATAGVVRFAIGLRGGTAWLQLPAAPAAAGAGSGVSAALALAPALPGLPALQQWLGQPFEWLDPMEGPAPPTGTLTLSLAALPGAKLTLPTALLPFGRSPPAEWASQWPLVRARCRLQLFEATALAEEALCEGALLLLPGSFAAQPPGAGLVAHLQLPGWPLLALPRWVPGSGVIELAGAQVEGMPPTQVGGWSVELEAPLVVPAQAWFGGGGLARPADGPIVARPSEGPVVLRLASRRVALGELVPVAQGWALRLVQVLHEANA